jgi:hypothetical protein
MNIKKVRRSAPNSNPGAVEEPPLVNKPPKLGKLGTVEDLARRWRCSPKTIRNRLSSGELVLGTKVFGRVLFDLDEVVAYETDHRIAARTKFSGKGFDHG